MLYRTRFWILSVVLLAALAEARAQVKAEPALIDLGKLKQDVTATAEVLLRNVGAQPVELTGASADCGCTVATLKTKSLAPGESTMLGLSVQTRNYQGIIRRTVRVQTSAGEVTVPVDMTVIAYEHWTITPTAVVMPMVQKEAEPAAHATLTYTGEGKAKFGKIICAPDYLEVNTASDDGRKFELTFKKRSDAPVGNHSIKVTVETSDAVDPRLSLNVFLPNATNANNSSTTDTPTPKVALRIIPTTIMLPTVTVGQRSTREITLRGWTSKTEPRLTLNQGQVTLLSQQAGELHYEMAMTPTRPGSFNSVLRVFDGERFLLESNVIIRAELATVTK